MASSERDCKPEPTPIEAFIRETARAVAREEIAGALAGAAIDPFVLVVDVLPGDRRHANRVCRSGAIAGAKKDGRNWVARLSAVEAYLSALPVPEPKMARDVDPVAAKVARLGFGKKAS